MTCSMVSVATHRGCSGMEAWKNAEFMNGEK